MKEGKILESVKTAIEMSMGMWGFMILGMSAVAVAYIKTESIMLTGFMWFVLLIGLAHLYHLEAAPVFVVMLVLFVGLTIYDIFIRQT